MPSIREIYDVLFDFAPAYMKMDWDNVGLVCGKFDTEVHRILVALDPMMTCSRRQRRFPASLS